MDSSSWINAYGNSTTGNSGFMCGYAAGLQCRDGDEQQQQHDLLVTSQMQHHLNQARIFEPFYSHERACESIDLMIKFLANSGLILVYLHTCRSAWR